jgi:hypothetical protein
LTLLSARDYPIESEIEIHFQDRHSEDCRGSSLNVAIVHCHAA